MSTPKFTVEGRVIYQGKRHWIIKPPEFVNDNWFYEIRLDDGTTGIAGTTDLVKESELQPIETI